MEFANVSVLITCYKKEPELSECIESIKRQSRPPREIILVHDGCEEGMAYEGVETVISSRNEGVAKARHRAFLNSSAPLILFVDADDVISPDYIEKMIRVISEGADIAYSDTYFWAKTEGELFVPPDILTPAYVQKIRKTSINVSAMMKREVYEKLGGFREFPVLEDTDFWLRAMSNDYTLKRAQTLLWYRQLKDRRNKIDYHKRKEVLEQILSKFEILKDRIIHHEK